MQGTDSSGQAIEDGSSTGLIDALTFFVAHRRLLVAGPILVGVLALGLTFVVRPTFTAKTTFLPPQQQGGAASALASLGSLAGLMGSSMAIKTPGDQYVSLLQSATVSDHIIDRFGLMKVYDVKYRFEARKELAEDVRISLGKKDGLITIEADAHDAPLAAGIANEYVTALRDLTGHLQLTEAQQRRAFYQSQLDHTSQQLAAAQKALQDSGFNPGALKAEPRAAADAYARLQAAMTDAEVKLTSLRQSLADSAPQVQQQLGVLYGLRDQMKKAQDQAPSQGDADYIGKYRAYKYQETLFDMFAKQYEMAKLDEAHDDSLIQVVDAATTPEHKSRPRRAIVAVGAAALSWLLLVTWLYLRSAWRRAAGVPENARSFERLNQALARKG